jgi:signal transduction histidine kinase
MAADVATESVEPESKPPHESPVPGCPLSSILLTEELNRRPSRPPEYDKENSALAALVRALAESPGTILQTLADKVVEVLNAGSAGLSLLTGDERRFFWAAIAGGWGPHVGGGTPREFGPCGDVLDRNTPMLFTHWERRYPYLSVAEPLAEEGLLVPFYVSGKAVGTIWAISHDAQHIFDAEDLRLLESLGRFASAAYQAVKAIELLDSNEVLQREIAERKRAEDDLRRSEALLAEAQRLSSTGSFSWRVATDEIRWSEQLYRIYELEVGLPVTLQLIRTRVHPEDVSLIEKMKAIQRAGGGDSVFEWQFRLLMPDRSVKYMHAIGRATRDRDGQTEYIAAVRDVTRRRQVDEALDKARSELASVSRAMSLGMLAASIAHEINQPLSGIVTNASTCLRMLGADPPDVEGALETARRTIRDAYRATEVVTRLRALFARKGPVYELVDLNEAAREVVALSHHKIQRDRVVLRTEYAESLEPVAGDRVELQQVILNLLLNALDAMSGVDDRPRQLVIKTEPEEAGSVRLSVQDAGVGFDPRSADRLFEMFYTTKSTGMGVGLSVSRSIIESHRGRLWAEANDGPGAMFSFSIPCRPELRAGL